MSVSQMGSIHDRARQLVQQSPRPMSLERAYQILGRRGAARRHRKAFTQPQPNRHYWWND